MQQSLVGTPARVSAARPGKGPGFDSRQRCLSFQQYPDAVWDPPSLLYSGTRGCFPEGKACNRWPPNVKVKNGRGVYPLTHTS
jgi:hypothetical protein